MSLNIIRIETPEEQELKKKVADLAELETILTQCELDLATLRLELSIFESKYNNIVGCYYAELDNIEAQIADLQAKLTPDDPLAQQRAAYAHAQAEESAKTTGAIKGDQPYNGISPSENLKKLYRIVAKYVHPDLAIDEKEREKRHHIMAQVNNAYERGDEVYLKELMYEWENNLESIKGNDIGSELIRVIRKIAQVKGRLQKIQVEMTGLQQSDLNQLRLKVIDAESEGRNLLLYMATDVKRQILEAQRQWTEISKKRTVL